MHEGGSAARPVEGDGGGGEVRYVLDRYGWLVRVRAASDEEAAEKLIEGATNLSNPKGENRV